jgi:hypothetical protein
VFPRLARWARLDASHACLLVLVAVLTGALLAVPPVGEFAVDDDWVYAQAVHQLLTDGVYQPSIWIDTTFVAQAWWGAGASLLLGFSHTTLRLSTLLLAAVALVLYNRLLCRSLRPLLALLTTLLLLFNPLFFHLSYTFMTDIPFLAVVLAAIWCLSVALEAKRGVALEPVGSEPAGQIRLGWLAAGSVLIGLACLVRQIGIVLVPLMVLGAIPELLPEVRTRRARCWPLLAALLVPCSLVMLSGVLLTAQPRDVTVDTRLADVLPTLDLASLWAAALRVLALAAALLGISVAPAAPLVLWGWIIPSPLQPPSPGSSPLPRGGGGGGWGEGAIRGLMVGLFAILGYVVAVRGGVPWYGLGPGLLAVAIVVPWLRVRMTLVAGAVAITVVTAIVSEASLSPLFGNTLAATGFTPSGLHPQAISVDGSAMMALVAGALLGAMALIVAFVGQLRLTRLPVSTRLLILASFGMLVVTLGYETVDGPFNGLYDRYLIPVLPGALAICALVVRERRLAIPVLAAGVLLFAGWSVSWQREYMQRQAAIWQMAQTITSQGVPPAMIGAGFEWNGTYRAETVIPQARDEAIQAGDPRQFVQRVIDGLYRPRRWYVDLTPPASSSNCPDQAPLIITYGDGWLVYGVRHCFGRAGEFRAGQQTS